jgi:predicted metalloprotease
VKWRGRGAGGRIEDRRGAGGTLGGGLPLPIGVGGGGIGSILIILLIVFLSSRGGGGLGIDPGVGGLPQAPGATPSTDLEATPADDPGKFVDFVAGDVDAVWTKIFSESGQTYEKPVVVLYDNAVQSGCGTTSNAVGPFYCPNDKKVYLDLTFMQQLQQRLGAEGDFAQAYIVAHEIGHHVQNLLGVMADVDRERQEDPGSANELSVRLELQADCLAGVWGHSAYTRKLLESGDVEEGLNAAAAVGDDRIQQQSGGRVDPDSFTHGTSEQRVKWFRAGFDSGDPTACDTFKNDV